MSILQEYENIRKEIGETTYDAIEKYLELHQELFLSDIYYKRAEWEKFEKWYNKVKDVIDTLSKSDVIYSVEYWTEATDEMLNSYAETEYYFGKAYQNKSNEIAIYRFQTGNEDLEEWLVTGLNQKEIDYIDKSIMKKLLKEVK